MTVEETDSLHKRMNRLSAVVGTLLVDGFHYLALFAIGGAIVWSAVHAFYGMAAKGGMFTGMKVTPITMAIAVLIAAVVGFMSSFIPSYNASKVNIVDGLRHIG